MRGIKRFFAQLPAYVLWLLCSVVLWSWIVSLCMDTVPAKKVTLFLDVPTVEATALSAALEEELPPELKMVRARSFSYVLFQQDALRAADLYVLPASEMAEFADELLPLEAPAGADVWAKDGVVYGLRCYDAAAGSGAAASLVQYCQPGRTPEDCFICVAAGSPHIGDGAALQIAARFLELE